MSTHTHPTLGSLIALEATASRDAIHVAIAPIVAAGNVYLNPGQPFALDVYGLAQPCLIADAVGVVDPFLKASVRPGERFWGCITPGTTHNLRHEWDNRHFAAPVAPTVERIEVPVEKPEDPEVAKVREFAKAQGLTLTEVIDEASQNLNAECRGCY